MPNLVDTETLQGQNERHLLHFLFKEKHYNPLERPVANESKPIIIKFGITLQQIIDIVRIQSSSNRYHKLYYNQLSSFIYK